MWAAMIFRNAQIGLALPLPGDPNLVATIAPLRYRSPSHVIGSRILHRRVEIPIERAVSSLRSTSRGFLPWRLSDDGPVRGDRLPMGPSSETLHTSGLPRCKKIGRSTRHEAPTAIGCPQYGLGG